MIVIEYLVFVLLVVILLSPLRFEGTAGAAGAAGGGGDAGGAAGAAGAAGGVEEKGAAASEAEAAKAAASETAAAEAAAVAAKAKAAPAAAKLSIHQQALADMSPEDAEWAYAELVALQKKAEEEAAAAGRDDGKAKAAEGAKGDERSRALEARIEQLEGKLSKADRQGKLEAWVAGVGQGVAKHDLAKDLDEAGVQKLAQLAMGHGGINRQLDPVEAVKGFVADIEPVLEALVSKRSAVLLDKWKREFLSGKVAAATTLGEGAAEGTPERGEEEHKPTDLADGTTAERARKKARLRAVTT